MGFWDEPEIQKLAKGKPPFKHTESAAQCLECERLMALAEIEARGCTGGYESRLRLLVIDAHLTAVNAMAKTTKAPIP